MTTLTVHYKGQTHELSLSDQVPPTIGALQVEIERLLGVQQDAQRLFQKRRRVDCSDAFRLVTDAFDFREGAAPLFLVAGASAAQIEDMKESQDAVQRQMKIRESRRVVNISKLNQGLQARDAVATSYRFHAIEPLKQFADQDKARVILEKLANDRGILAVMAKHEWSVGTLAEMPPDGKVGVDPVCVLGLNQNKGQKILLRLRTDDLLGFRKFLSIKKVLFHELSHNVHSEHDSKFYQLMRQVEKECNELDWTSSHGAVVGGSRAAFDDDSSSRRGSPSGHRLGGGSGGPSRLLTIPPPAPSTTQQQQFPAIPSISPDPESLPVTSEDIEDVEMKGTGSDTVDAAPVQQATTPETPRPQSPKQIQSHERTVDEEVATMAMSDRERRIHNAVRHLQRHYSAESISKAVSLLYKIVSNIITHPSDAKFRSIRKTNRLFDGQVARFPECLDFLLALGFEDQSDKFVLAREDQALLWIGRSTLEVLLPAVE